MKKIFRFSLAALLLVALLLSAVSCEFGMESITGYTQLRDHIIDEVGYDQNLNLNEYATIRASELEEGGSELCAAIGAMTASGVPVRIFLTMNGSVEKVYLVCEILDPATAAVAATGKADILLTHYTGNETLSFESVENMNMFSENTYREFATTLLNSLLLALDTYACDKLDINVRDMGFIALSDKYMANVETVEAEEDLGGAFSAARWTKAGLMILQGLGMVFLVLAILWIVLLIFKAVFYKDPAKEASKAEKPAKTEKKETPSPAPAPVAAPAPAADDAQLIAVITAAVAAAIESDPALTSQFSSGFRVVSFKKTDKSRNR